MAGLTPPGGSLSSGSRVTNMPVKRPGNRRVGSLPDYLKYENSAAAIKRKAAAKAEMKKWTDAWGPVQKSDHVIARERQDRRRKLGRASKDMAAAFAAGKAKTATPAQKEKFKGGLTNTWNNRSLASGNNPGLRKGWKNRKRRQMIINIANKRVAQKANENKADWAKARYARNQVR